MTLEEKLAQLASVWLNSPDDGDGAAPLQGEFTAGMPPLPELIRDGLGQLTRVFGTRPVAPAEGVRALARLQSQVVAASRFGIPAIAHEECLTGLTAWTATVFPTPPQLAEQAGRPAVRGHHPGRCFRREGAGGQHLHLLAGPRPARRAGRRQEGGAAHDHRSSG